MSLTDEAGEPLTAQQIDSAMDTGQGADDEPEMNIGDRYAEKYGDELPEDAGGGGTPSLEEAARLLGDDAEKQKATK